MVARDQLTLCWASIGLLVVFSGTNNFPPIDKQTEALRWNSIDSRFHYATFFPMEVRCWTSCGFQEDPYLGGGRSTPGPPHLYAPNNTQAFGTTIVDGWMKKNYNSGLPWFLV